MIDEAREDIRPGRTEQLKQVACSWILCTRNILKCYPAGFELQTIQVETAVLFAWIKGL